MHQYFILVLVSILKVLKYSLKPQMKMVILCMIAISVSHQTCRPQNIKVIHECQVAKGMTWDIVIVKSGGGGGGFGGYIPRENFIILEVHVCDFNALFLDHWFYNHRE